MTLPLPTYFADFLQDIRPTPTQRGHMVEGHTRLRELLQSDTELKTGFVGMFLQGSYKRRTAVRPKDDKRADVDLIVVTRMKESEFTPAQAMACFKPFLDRHYRDKYRQQGRSFGIKMSTVEMDLVITAAPVEAEAGVYSSFSKNEDVLHLNDDEAQPIIKEAADGTPLWKTEPLRIPDRDLGKWQDTHPLVQLSWTSQKSARCSGHFINVVKALKWWRLVHAEALPDRPKSYPLEHLIGDCCPDGISSVAEGVVRTLEQFSQRYAFYAANSQTPYAPDRGVDQNVMARIGGDDFAKFHQQVATAAKTARKAFDAPDPQTAAPLWRELFGDKFPRAPDTGGPSSPGSFTSHQGGPGVVSSGRFA
jgi:hypothetical protein